MRLKSKKGNLVRDVGCGGEKVADQVLVRLFAPKFGVKGRYFSVDLFEMLSGEKGMPGLKETELREHLTRVGALDKRLLTSTTLSRESLQ